MTTVIGGSSPSITFSDSTTQSTAFTGLNQSATPYTTSLGYQAANSTTGTYNVAIGYQSLVSNTTASNNTAVGYQSAYSNTTGSLDAFGWRSLYSNTTGIQNGAFGRGALYANTTGQSNSAFGSGDSSSYGALQSNTTGSYNTAVGNSALAQNTTASYNTAVGYQAGYTANAAGNTHIGYQAGYGVTSGSYNTFVGIGAGLSVTSGGSNTILGAYSGNQGGLDIRTSSNYIVLSDGAGNPRIYHSGATLYSTLSASAGSFAVKTAAGGAITYDSSSARYKDNIRDSSYGIEAVMKLRSTMFEYKDSGRTDVGFIAEEVDLVIPELVPKIGGVPEAVSYDRMVSVLVKAIQDLNNLITAQATEIEALKAKVGI